MKFKYLFFQMIWNFVCLSIIHEYKFEKNSRIKIPFVSSKQNVTKKIHLKAWICKQLNIMSYIQSLTLFFTTWIVICPCHYCILIMVTYKCGNISSIQPMKWCEMHQKGASFGGLGAGVRVGWAFLYFKIINSRFFSKKKMKENS